VTISQVVSVGAVSFRSRRYSRFVPAQCFFTRSFVPAGDETRAAETLRLERRGGRLGRRIVTPVHAGDGQHAARGTRNRLFHQLLKSNVTSPIGGVCTRRTGMVVGRTGEWVTVHVSRFAG